MEYLLFPKEGDTFAQLTGDPKRRRYLFLIAREIAGQADRLQKVWQKPYAESAKRILTPGVSIWRWRIEWAKSSRQ